MRIGEHWSRLNQRSRYWLAAAALCTFVLLAYANSFECGLVLDNSALLTGDQRIRRATLENLTLILKHSYWWPAGADVLYRPVTTLSYLFNYAILGNGENPAGYHWVNLLLHAGNVLLVFALARRLVREFWPSFLIAAVWALHPVLTESVTNIVGRADLLAGMTVLGGLLIYLKSSEAAGARRLAWLAGLMAITGVGVFCKESAVAVAGAIALYELTWWNPKRLNGFIEACLAMSPAFLAMWWVRATVLTGSEAVVFPFVENPIAGAAFWTGRLTAIRVMAKYLGLLIWPANLSADYSYAQIPLADGRLTDWIAWIVVAAAVIGTVFLYRRNKTAFFAACFAFMTLLPASNLVIPVGTIMAERFLYLPAIGFAICLILAVYSVGQQVRAGVPAAVILCLLIATGFGARTWARNRDWQDDYTFWSVAARTSPLSFKTHIGWARAWQARGERDEAIAESERALVILDSLPIRLILPSLFYIETAVHYVEKGDHLRWRGLDGKLRTPPESIASYKRANTLLLRGAFIIRGQREAGRDKRGLSGVSDHPELFSSDVDIYIKRMLTEVGERLASVQQ